MGYSNIRVHMPGKCSVLDLFSFVNPTSGRGRAVFIHPALLMFFVDISKTAEATMLKFSDFS